jgi:hypothetical protein
MAKLLLLTTLLADAPPCPDLDGLCQNYGAGYYKTRGEQLAVDLEALYPKGTPDCEAACGIAERVRKGEINLDPPKRDEGKQAEGGGGGGGRAGRGSTPEGAQGGGKPPIDPGAGAGGEPPSSGSENANRP